MVRAIREAQIALSIEVKRETIVQLNGELRQSGVPELSLEASS